MNNIWYGLPLNLPLGMTGLSSQDEEENDYSRLNYLLSLPGGPPPGISQQQWNKRPPFPPSFDQQREAELREKASEGAITSSIEAGVTSAFQNLIEKIMWTAKKALYLPIANLPNERDVMKIYGEAVRSGKMKSKDLPAGLVEKYGTPEEPTMIGPGNEVDQAINKNILYPLREKTSELIMSLRRKGVQDQFISQILEGVGAASVDLPMYAATGQFLGPLNFAVHGFVEGMQGSDDDLMGGGLPGAVRGAIVDKVFQAAHEVLGEGFTSFSKQLRARGGTAAGMAGSNVLGAVTEGETPQLKDIASSAIVGALLPTGKKEGVKEVQEEVKYPRAMTTEEEFSQFMNELRGVTLGVDKAEDLFKPGKMEPEAAPPIEGKPEKGVAEFRDKMDTFKAATDVIPGYREAGWLARLLGAKDRSVEKLGEWLDQTGLKNIVKDPLNPKIMTEITRGWVGSAQSILERGPYRITESGDIARTNEGMEPIYKDFVAVSGIRPREAVDLLSRYWDVVRIETDLQQVTEKFEYDAKAGRNVKVVKTKASEKDKEWAAKERAKIDALIGERPELKQYLDQSLQRKNAFQHAWLEMWVESGLISRESADRMKAENPNHIPFKRIIAGMDDPTVIDQLTGDVTFSTIFGPKPFRQFKGGEFERENSAETQAQRVFAGERIMLQNRTKQAIARMSEFLPEIFEKPTEFEPSTVTMEEIRQAVESHGGQIDPGELKNMIIFRPKDIQHLEKDIKGNPYEMLVYFDGKPRIYHVPTTIAEVFSHLSPASGPATVLPNLLKLTLGIPKRFLQRGATSWNPVFALYANPIRDNLGAFMQTNLGFKPFVDPYKLAFDMANKDYYEDILSVGGGMEGYSVMNRKHLLKTARELAGDKTLLRRLNVFRYIEDMGHYMEMLTRKTIVKKAKEAGMSDIAAAAASRTSTIDFLRSGYAARQINGVVDFFNASVQGGAMFMKAFKNNPVKTTIKGMSLIALPQILFFLLNHKDEETAMAYKSKPQYEKDFFFSIPDTVPVIGGLHFPKPVGYGQFFGSLLERGMQRVIDKDPHAYDGLTGMLAGSVSPVGGSGGGFDIEGLLPTGIQLIAELYANEDMFRESEIYPPWKKEQDLAEDRYGTWTQDIYKRLGEIPVALGAEEGIPPAYIQHTVKSLAGPTGEAVMTGINLLTGEKRKPSEPVTEDIPFLKQLTSRSSQSAPKELSQFYKWLEKLKQAKGSYNQAKKMYEKAVSDYNVKSTDENKGLVDRYQKKKESIEKRFPLIKDTPAGDPSADYRRALALAKEFSEIRDKIDQYVQSDLPGGEIRKRIRELERVMWLKSIEAQKYFGF